jgi:hypothetical protein
VFGRFFEIALGSRANRKLIKKRLIGRKSDSYLYGPRIIGNLAHDSHTQSKRRSSNFHIADDTEPIQAASGSKIR